MSRYEQLPASAFEQLVTGAGIICTSFTPDTGAFSGLVAATKGGMTFNPNPVVKDWGEDVDNCPKRTMELMRIDEYDPSLSGTALTIDDTVVGMLMAAATKTTPTTTGGATKFTPRHNITDDDFIDTLWFVANYSDDTSASTGGSVAILIKNAMNTTGFQMTTTDREKGEFSFEFHGHYSISDPDDVPFEVYIRAGTGS